MRRRICAPGAIAAFSSATAPWMARAHSTACTALGNSAIRLSPTLPKTRPSNSRTSVSNSARRTASAASVAASSAPISRL